MHFYTFKSFGRSRRGVSGFRTLKFRVELEGTLGPTAKAITRDKTVPCVNCLAKLWCTMVNRGGGFEIGYQKRSKS